MDMLEVPLSFDDPEPSGFRKFLKPMLPPRQGLKAPRAPAPLPLAPPARPHGGVPATRAASPHPGAALQLGHAPGAEAPPVLARELERQADRGSLAAPDLSSALWSAAALSLEEGEQQPPWQLLPLLADRLLGRFNDLDGHGVVDALWAAATLRRDAPVLHTLLPALVLKLNQTLDSLPAQDTAIAFSTLASLAAELLDLDLEVRPIIDQMLVRIAAEASSIELWALVNSLRATAAFRLGAPKVGILVPAVAEEIWRRAEELSARGVAVTLWSLASLTGPAAEEARHGPLLRALVARARTVAGELDPNEFATFVWSLGACDCSLHEAGRLLRAWSLELACALDEAGAGELGLALWGFAALGHRDDEALEVAASRMAALAPGLPPDVLVTAVPRTVWACARLGYENVLLLSAASECLDAESERMRFLQESSIHALLWSFDRLDEEYRFWDFRDTLMAKLKYWVRTRRSYVKISPKVPQRDQYRFMMQKAIGLGALGPDVRRQDYSR